MMSFHDIVDFLLRALEASGPVIAFLMWQHGLRNKRFEQRFKAVNNTLKEFDRDLNGLTRQIGEVLLDAERRYVNKEDHVAAVQQLTHQLSTLNDRLFEVLRAAGHHMGAGE